MKNPKIAISRQQFDQLTRNLVRLRTLPLQTGRHLKILLWKIKMADGRHLEKSKNGHIFATVWPIGTTFGMMTHIGPPNRTGSWNFKLLFATIHREIGHAVFNFFPFVFSVTLFFVTVPCATLGWPSRQRLSARKYTISHRIVLCHMKGYDEVVVMCSIKRWHCW